MVGIAGFTVSTWAIIIPGRQTASTGTTRSPLVNFDGKSFCIMRHSIRICCIHKFLFTPAGENLRESYFPSTCFSTSMQRSFCGMVPMLMRTHSGSL